MPVSVPTSLSAADLMRYVKGSSSRWVHQELPGRHDFGWQRDLVGSAALPPSA